MRIKKTIGFIFLMLLISHKGYNQISPGDLAAPHAQLEGMSNCTQCHILGEKVSNDKCLKCHSELKKRIDQQKGYHSSSIIRGKECVSCHSDHHGRNFEIVRIVFENFDHNLTGYELAGAHAKKQCKDCHKPEFITDPEVKKKNKTYLGLGTECLTCHADYHQKTLSSNCISCHDFVAFKPASKFDHSKAKYQLLGKHQQVECLKCHKLGTLNREKFQQFTGILFDLCTDCHRDVHENQFGQNCRQCHTEESFHNITEMKGFDHSKTTYKLEGKHKLVKCASCHKTKYTDPIKHDKCKDCHTDYHNKQFAKQGVSPDCAECHNLNSFTGSSYTIEKHNTTVFQLQGGHVATPCFACHLKDKKWSFRNIGKRCVDCHKDIHEALISEKFYPEKACENCHKVEKWSEINFEHSKTKFELTGAHQKQSCRSCHFIKQDDGTVQQHFIALPTSCINCHSDKHNKQFEKNGVTDCLACHDVNNWKPEKFNHNNTRFKLDGKHQNVACIKCHKPVITDQLTYILYKLEDIRCEACHK